MNTDNREVMARGKGGQGLVWGGQRKPNGDICKSITIKVNQKNFSLLNKADLAFNFYFQLIVPNESVKKFIMQHSYFSVNTCVFKLFHFLTLKIMKFFMSFLSCMGCSWRILSLFKLRIALCFLSGSRKV